MTQTGTILAIDYGTKRVGTALSHASLAEPYTILPNNSGLIEAIQHIVQNEQITQIVIGLSENQMAELTQKFAAELAQSLAVPIKFYDETLSSYEVHQKMRAGAHSKSQRGAAIDHLAAAEMLQNYLDEKEQSAANRDQGKHTN